MSTMKHSELLERLAIVESAANPDLDIMSLLLDVADSNCSCGYDSDGSTGSDIFENGFDLAIRAEGRPVQFFALDCFAFFFIGTEAEVEARLRRAIAEGVKP